MKRWLVLALLGLAVIWGPYVYSELASEPVPASGKQRNMLRLFGADDEEEAAAEDLPAEPEPEPEAAEAPTEPEKAAQDKPSAEPAAEAKPAAEDLAEPAEGEVVKAEAPADDTAHPTLPGDLVPAFRKVFEAEPRDAFWANDEEGKVRAVFASAGAAPEAVAEVACRKTVCRVTFTPDEVGPDALTKLYETLRARHPDGLALDHKTEPVGQAGTLFMLRAGYQLEH